ncbi:MAG: phosphatase PAP2 family protein [Dysgonomonas sp.]|nr:phosphatase PAP2 family protein [Dysgonomonas sp.]
MINNLDDIADGASELLNLGNSSGQRRTGNPDNVEKEPVWAQITSIVLHPLLMTLYGVCLLFLYTDFSFMFAGQFSRFFIPVLFLSCVVPLTCIYIMKRMGVISDYDIKNKNERFVPFLATFLSYSILVYFFYLSGLYIWFLTMLAAPLILILIGAITTHYWKISAHMMGIGCLIGCILSVCYNIKGINPYHLFIILFILAGCLGVSRLILKRHTPAQVYVGFLVGLVVSYICVLIGGYWGIIAFLKNI